MNFRKWMAALAAGALLTLGIPLTAGAEANYDGMSTDGTYGYHIMDDGTISVYCEDTEITAALVPETIDGYTVTRLESGCFSECMNLAELTIPDGVTSIGEKAFFDCDALTELTLSANVTQLDNYALDGATGLTAITVAEENPSYQSLDGILFDKSGGVLIKYPEARPDTSYTVPDACHTLADWAFVGSKYLETITMDTVTSIGTDVFYYCVALKSVAIPEGITELPDNLFGCCIALETVTLPSTLKTIGESCFFSCTSLKAVNLPEGLESIKSYAFTHCTALTELTVPASVATVTAYCMGYKYDDTTGSYVVQDNFTLYVEENSPVHTYASSNGIAYEFEKHESYVLYYVLIGIAAAVICGLVAAIVKVSRKTK